MALRLHIEERNWRCVYNILRCVYKMITMRLYKKKIVGDAFIEWGKKMQLAPPGNSHCGRRTLQAWPGCYGAFFLLLFPFCLARENR